MKSFGTKRILSLLVAVCMLVAMLPASLVGASAAGVGTTYRYKFWEAMTAAGATGTGTAFSQSYQASQDANVGSAEWMIQSVSNNYFAVSTAPYRIFTFGAKGGSDIVTWKINVPEDGIYDATWQFYQYAASAAPEVYLTKVGAGSENFLMKIDKTSATSDRAVTASNVLLAAGDYYLTVKQIATYSGDETNRYFCPHEFDLTLVAEYDPSEVSQVVFDKTNIVLGVYGADAITPSVLPETADDGSVVYTWTSSDENVVFVEDGILTPIGPGFASVTATTENGKFATANVLVTDETSFEYNFTKGWQGNTSTNVVALSAMGYPQTMAGSPSEVVCSNGYVETAPWAFEALLSEGTTASVTSSYPIGAALTTIDCRGYTIVAKDNGGVSFRIAVPVSGEYKIEADLTKGNGYGSGTFYLAPASATNPQASEYALGDEVSFQSSTLADHSIVNLGYKILEAGEYIVSVKGVINALFWRSLSLTNGNMVDEVFFGRDSLNVALGESRLVAAKAVPTTAPNTKLTYASNNETVVAVDENGVITALKKGTAVITATAVADGTKTDSITVNVGDKVFCYDFMKTNGFGLVPTKEENKYLTDCEYANDFKYTTSGSLSEVGIDYESYGWKIGPVVNSSEWTWSESAVALGLYNYVNKASAANGYASISIEVPLAGTYDLISIHSLWKGGKSCDYYLAPADAENPVDAKYKVNAAPINHNDSVNRKTEALVGEVTLEAGEYLLSFYSEEASGVFVRGIRLSDASIVTLAESITLDQSGVKSLVTGESLTATATVFPVNADNKAVRWESSDPTIATVVDGLVTQVGEGVVTITATTTDGTNLSASFDVMCNMTLKYTYEFYDTMRTMFTGGNNVSAPKTEFALDDTKSVELGSAPWMFYGSSSEYLYFDYTNSSHAQGYGVFAMNNSTVGFWNRLKINVAEDGRYTGMLRVSDFPVSNSFDVYIAPVLAENPLAPQYKVGSFAPSGNALNTMQIALTSQRMAAGDYYITFVLTQVNGGSLIGLFDLELYYNAPLYDGLAPYEPILNFGTVNGASLRSKGVQGLRFISTFEKINDFGIDGIVEYGTVLIPTEALGGNIGKLTIGNAAGGVKVAKVPANVLYSDTEEELSYTAVVTDIAPEYYTREITARAYVLYKDSEGFLRAYYSDTNTGRSPYTVAQRGLADPNVSDADKAVFQAIIDAVNAQE